MQTNHANPEDTMRIVNALQPDDGPDRNRDLRAAADSYRTAEERLSQAEDDVEVARDAVAEADCDSFDAHVHGRKAELDEATTEVGCNGKVGFISDRVDREHVDLGKVDIRVARAVLEFRRAEAVLQRAELEADRARRCRDDARETLVAIALDEG